MSKSAESSREEILAEYYAKYYHSTLYENSCQSLGTKYFDSKLERSWRNLEVAPKKLLEVGFASGEHISKVRNFPTEEYVGLDINPPVTQHYIQAMSSDHRSKLKIVLSDASNMPFADNTFDRLVSTCLLHHVQNPLKVLQEIRRVTTNGGEIAIGLPADPGALNRVIKFLITYPAMRKQGIKDPRLIYALEHPNQIGGLVTLARHVFGNDILRVTFEPFKIHSWNFNLMVVLHVTVVKPK